MQKELKKLSDSELIQNTKKLVQEERTLLTQILWHLKEIDDRKIYLTEGFSSLFDYTVQILNYSESQAYRRIAAMRVLRDLPEIENKLDSGELKLTQITMAQEYFRSEKKKGEPVAQTKKIEILDEISDKSARETERYFAALSPEMISKDKTRPVSENQIEIKFVAEQRLLDKLNRFKELDSHVEASPNYARLFERLVDLALKQKDPAMKAVGKTAARKASEQEASEQKTLEFSAPKKSDERNSDQDGLQPENCAKNSEINSDTKNPRFTPALMKRAVLARDQGRCVYKNPETGKICGSRFQVQIDHIIPVALHGESTLDNLRCLCRAHNIHEASRIFGAEKMEEYSSKS